MRPSKLALAAAAISGAVAVLYLVLVARGRVGGDDGLDGRTLLFVALFVVLPLCAAAGALRPTSNTGIGLLAVAAVGLGVLGVLGILTIGLPLLIASAMLWVTLARVRSGRSETEKT